MPKLIIKAGTPQAQEFELKPGKNYVGRGFANDVKLDDASVSGSHALITVDGSTVMVKDLGSTNGTRINQLPATESPLQSGHVVRLGSVELLFVADAVSSAPQPAAVPPPPPTAASQIATEFFIRDPSRVGVAPATVPPAPVQPSVELKIPGITSPPPPAPVPQSFAPGAPSPVPAASALVLPPPPAPVAPAPIVIPPAVASVPPPPTPVPVRPNAELKIPSLTPPAPPPPVAVAPAPIVISSPPPPAPVLPPSPVPIAPVPIIIPPSNVVKPPTPAPVLQPLAPPPVSNLAAAVAEAPLPSGPGLKLSGMSHMPAPAPVAIEPSTPVTQPAAAPAVSVGAIEAPPGKTVCKFHKTTPGQWLCQKCDQLFCSLCVSTRPTPAGVGYFCRTCGTQCVQVKVKLTAKKEKKLTAYSDATVLLRTVGFGLGGAVVAGGVWAGFTAVTGFDMPAIFAPVTGLLCGYAIKIASQDRPGGFFSLMAIVATLLGVTFGMLGAILITHHFLFTINSLAIGVFGLVFGIFIAWKVGGGDF